jgi:hypothetical protein
MSEDHASLHHNPPNSATIAGVFRSRQAQTALLLVVSTM